MSDKNKGRKTGLLAVLAILLAGGAVAGGIAIVKASPNMSFPWETTSGSQGGGGGGGTAESSSTSRQGSGVSDSESSEKRASDLEIEESGIVF